MLTAELSTVRLNLRSLSPADLPFLSMLAGDERVRKYLGGPVPLERRERATANYLTVDSDEAVWLVETRRDSRPIGVVFLSPHRDGEGLELSYQFDPAIWGMSYAFEATQAVLDHAAIQLSDSRIVAETQSANLRSCRLLERLGMTELRRVSRFGAEQIIFTKNEG